MLFRISLLPGKYRNGEVFLPNILLKFAGWSAIMLYRHSVWLELNFNCFFIVRCLNFQRPIYQDTVAYNFLVCLAMEFWTTVDGDLFRGDYFWVVLWHLHLCTCFSSGEGSIIFALCIIRVLLNLTFHHLKLLGITLFCHCVDL